MLFSRIKIWVENSFNVLLFSSIVLGLFFPWAQSVPDIVIFLLIGTMVFLSCARITKDELSHIKLSSTLAFYLVRFILLPCLLYLIACLVLPQYKEAALLLALIPPGATTGAVSNIFGGNVASAIGYIVVASLLAPFTISTAFYMVGYQGIEIDALGVMTALALVIFIPIVVYFGMVYKHESARKFTASYSKLLTILLLIALLTIVVGKQRDTILSDPVALLKIIPYFSAIYLVFYLIAWKFPLKAHDDVRISQTICSGMNNLSLSIGVAIMYFPDEVTLIMVSMHLPWSIALMIFKRFVEHNAARK